MYRIARAGICAALVLSGVHALVPGAHAQTLKAQVKPATEADAWKTMTELSKVNLDGLTAEQKNTALEIMRAEGCNCGCGMKIAECRVKDRNCPISPGLAANIVTAVKAGKGRKDIVADLQKPRETPKKPEQAGSVGDAVEIEIGDSPSKGPKDAKVTIVEWSDFECPFCARAIPWVESILKAYPEDVRVVFKQFPLSFHKNATTAAIASLAANDQGKFWPMHDKLFENYRSLKRENILTWAKELGLDMAKFEAAMDDEKYQKIIDKEMAQGKKAGVRGTPSFYINGKRYSGGRNSVDSIKPLIEKELKPATAATTTKPAEAAPKPAAAAESITDKPKAEIDKANETFGDPRTSPSKSKVKAQTKPQTRSK